ncbi:MAG: DUF4093 domain-containing protein [Clostridia bacterium]|nr:DUF4093 domain-containing protein [Clostridia bacterium]
MIKTDKIVIVEGKYDKIKLSSLIDAVIIETEGFGIFKDKEKQKLIRKLAKEKGLLVITDSDSAGFKIRSFISSIVPNEYITNAYVPDVLGKEKRKTEASKEGKLGVEGVPSKLILEALRKAGVSCDETENKDRREITLADLYLDGLSGSADSSNKRKKLLKYLELPERMSTKSLLEIMNIFLSYDEYKSAVSACAGE